MLGQLEEIQIIGLNHGGFILRDSLTSILTTKGIILSTSLLEPEEEFVLKAHLHPELWNWPLQCWCVTFIGIIDLCHQCMSIFFKYLYYNITY